VNFSIRIVFDKLGVWTRN